jgi:hypothetical protein
MFHNSLKTAKELHVIYNVTFKHALILASRSYALFLYPYK